MTKAVVHLWLPRSIWSYPNDLIGRIRAAFGERWDVVNVHSSTGARRSETVAEAARAARGAEVYFGWGIPTEVVRAATGTLKWAHTAAAGVGSSVTPEFRASGATLTNSQGVHADPMADWVVAALGFCARGFFQAARAQQERCWDNTVFTAADAPVMELADMRVGLVGLGGIGKAVAARCAGLGMEVRAVRRQPSKPGPEAVSWIGGPNEVVDMAASCDALVMALPYTSETKAIVNDAVLSALPRGAFVLNVSRGALLDEEALLRHLDSGQLGGCVLDVVENEPLQSEHPFWTHPKVFLTPHVSAVTHRFWERESPLIEENIRRYVRGESLRNIVNLEAGY